MRAHELLEYVQADIQLWSDKSIPLISLPSPRDLAKVLTGQGNAVRFFLLDNDSLFIWEAYHVQHDDMKNDVGADEDSIGGMIRPMEGIKTESYFEEVYESETDYLIYFNDYPPKDHGEIENSASFNRLMRGKTFKVDYR